jgi:predicted transcriptional regulator
MRRVADAMDAPRVVVQPSTTVQATSAGMLDGRVHAAVVVDDGGVCGLITAERLSAALAEGYDVDTAIGQIADRKPMLLDPDEALAEAHQIMRAEGQRFAVVVDSKRHALGLLEDPEAASS